MTITDVAAWADAFEEVPLALANVPWPGSWASRGSCRDQPDWLFFPSVGESVKVARSVCDTCPVREPCLDYAVAAPELEGVWAGTTGRERSRLRKERAEGAAAAVRSTQSSPGTLYRTLLELVRHHQVGTWASVAAFVSPESGSAMASNCRTGRIALPPGAWEFEGRVTGTGSELYACYLGTARAAAS